MNIEQRISKLRSELQTLNAMHDNMVQEKTRADQEFNAQVQKNQHRFQQLVGAISELEKLQQEATTENGEGDSVRMILERK